MTKRLSFAVFLHVITMVFPLFFVTIWFVFLAIINRNPCYEYTHLSDPYVTVPGLLLSAGGTFLITSAISYIFALILFNEMQAKVFALFSVVLAGIITWSVIFAFPQSFGPFLPEICSLLLVGGSQLAGILLAFFVCLTRKTVSETR